MKIKQVATAVIAALAVPVLVLAADRELFKRIDTDGSNTISREELIKSELVVVEGKDGKKQVKHRDMVKDAQAAALSEEEKHRLFDTIDRNKDGFINRKEWNRASPNGFILWKF